MHYKNVKGILSAHNGMNLYRGCTHGCIYCDSRSSCYQIDHDFEDVEVKINAPQLLEEALKSKRKKVMISTGSMCDPYLPLEQSEELTRTCLKIIYQYGFGVNLLTKSDLVLRDLDLLKAISEKTKCVVQMTLTTFDRKLCQVLEPNVCITERRIEVLNIMRDNNIPTVVWLCPILPFINDSEENIRQLLTSCITAKVKGIVCFGMGVTLREEDREYFYQQLDEYFPGLKQRYIRNFGNSYVCNSPNNNYLMKIFRNACHEYGIICEPEDVFKYLAAFENNQLGQQLSLF